MPTISTPTRVAVLGAGSWGTALAALASQRAHTLLWARSPELCTQINQQHRNQRYLPDIALPDSLQASPDMAAVIHDTLSDDRQAALIILGVPVAGLAQTCAALARLLPPKRQHPVLVLWTCKGLQPDTALLPHQVVAQHLPHYPWLHTGVLSGPSFALEVAQGLPVALTLASHSAHATQLAIDVLHGTQARLYSSTDIIGVEIGGALKNIMAIACGIGDALGLGTNARAALITRGLAEMQRLGVAMGAHADTFAGLTGLGDLVLTATGPLSRNRQVGLALGQGQSLQDILDSGVTAEGVRCARAVQSMARAHNIDLPITDTICQILYEGLAPQEAVVMLLSREAKSE